MTGPPMYLGGSGSNYLCLHEEPEWNKYTGADKYGGRLNGVVYGYYDNYNNIFDVTLKEKMIPCAVCFQAKRSAQVVIPGRRNCPANWSKEYEGYLVTEYSGSARTSMRASYVCLDGAPETAGGYQSGDAGAIYSAKVWCGALPCDKFPDGRDLTCVVCTI